MGLRVSPLPLLWHSGRAWIQGRRSAPPWRTGEAGSSPQAALLVSQVLWHDVWSRPQEITLQMARRVPTHFISPTPAHRMLEARDRWRPEGERGGVQAHCPLTVPGDYHLEFIRRMNAHHAVRAVRRLGVAPEETALLLNTPFLPEVVESAPWGLVLFDWQDDFAAFDWAPAEAVTLQRRSLDRVDVMTSATRYLAKAMATEEQPVHFIQNGVRFEAYAECADPRPEDLPDGFDHIAGFIGTLGRQLNLDLIEQVAASLPEVAFVFIGPNRLHRRLRGSNIFTLGLRPFERLPAYVRHFDAGLIPYFDSVTGAEAINPTKLLEYAAAGVPVISTPLADVEMLFGDIAKVAPEPAGFAGHIRAACRGDLAAVAERARERARATTWEALGDALWEIILTAWREKHA